VRDEWLTPIRARPLALPLKTPVQGAPSRKAPAISAAFLIAFAQDFEAHGESVIQKVREEDPTAYLRIAAMIIPKEVEMPRSPLDD